MRTIEDLKRHAQLFRAAIKKCDRTKLPVSLQEFPCGACGDATLLLGTYLIENGYESFDYMEEHMGFMAEGNWFSHAWLQGERLVVDITADQFPGIVQTVIVGENSDWHRSLNGKTQRVADYRTCNSELESAYREILRNIQP